MASRKSNDEILREMGIEPLPKLRQGFATESSEAVREKGRKGGIAAQASGKAHRFSGKEAKDAGRRGANIRWATWRAARAMAEQTMLEALRARLGIGKSLPDEAAEAAEIARMSKDTHRELKQVQSRMKVSSTKSSLAEKIAAMALGRDAETVARERRVESEIATELSTKGPVELTSKERKLEAALLKEIEDPFGLD